MDDPSVSTNLINWGEQIGFIVGYVLTILGSAYFSASENAFSAANIIRLRNLKEDGNKRAAIALKLVDNFEQVLSTILIGLNVLLLLGASLATQFVFNLFGRLPEKEAVAATIATIVSAVLVYFFADMLPKSLAIAHPDGFALALAPSLYVLNILLFPLTIVVKGFTALLNKFFPQEKEPTVTEEEISDFIDTAEEEGVVDEEQSDLLQSALEFTDTTVADVLTLKKDLIGIELHTSKEDLTAFLKEQTHSRFPVYDGDLDHIVGVLQAKDFFCSLIQKKDAPLSSLITPVFYTTLDANIQNLLEEMSHHKQTMAIVRQATDGPVIGLVTMEDFLEELVGEIFDEDEVENDKFQNLGGNYFRVSGTCSMGDLFHEMDYHGKVNMSRVKTVSMWVLEQLGHFPEEDEIFEWRDLQVTITDVQDNKILFVELKLADPVLDAVTQHEEEDPS